MKISFLWTGDQQTPPDTWYLKVHGITRAWTHLHEYEKETKNKVKVLQERYYDVCVSNCFNEAVLICRAAEKEETFEEYDNNIVREVTNVDSEESVERKFVKQKKIYRK